MKTVILDALQAMSQDEMRVYLWFLAVSKTRNGVRSVGEMPDPHTVADQTGVQWFDVFSAIVSLAQRGLLSYESSSGLSPVKRIDVYFGRIAKRPLSDRKPLLPKTRFAVMRRDGFKCQYCGATAKTAELVIDHVVPVARGGSDDIENLVTACFECNAGKGMRTL